jgi:hypothetical protein
MSALAIELEAYTPFWNSMVLAIVPNTAAHIAEVGNAFQTQQPVIAGVPDRGASPFCYPRPRHLYHACLTNITRPGPTCQFSGVELTSYVSVLLELLLSFTEGGQGAVSASSDGVKFSQFRR